MVLPQRFESKEVGKMLEELSRKLKDTARDLQEMAEEVGQGTQRYVLMRVLNTLALSGATGLVIGMLCTFAGLVVAVPLAAILEKPQAVGLLWFVCAAWLIVTSGTRPDRDDWQLGFAPVWLGSLALGCYGAYRFAHYFTAAVMETNPVELVQDVMRLAGLGS